MGKIFANNFNKILMILYVVLSIGIVILVNKSIEDEVKYYKLDVNTNLSQKIHTEVATLIDEKKDATLAMAISLASNDIFKVALKKNDSSSISLKNISNDFRDNTVFKNIWLQILDKNGRSFLRSWTDKKGDDLSFREDVKVILKDKQIRTTLSVGRFSISFKSMVPIVENGELLGVFEIISHFNSIEKKLAQSGYSSLVLVDKKFEKQLTNSITKTFINGYYVANFEPNAELMGILTKSGVERYVENNQPYYTFDENHIILVDTIFSNEKEAIGYIVVYSPNGEKQGDIEHIKIVNYLYGFFGFLVLSLIFALLIDKEKLVAKLNDYGYNIKIITFMFVFFILFVGILYIFLEYEKESKLEQYLLNITKENEKIFNQIYHKYYDISTLIYKTKIDTQEVKNILR